MGLRMIMNKKGVELTFNTVVVGLITVVVLLVVITIFWGGTGQIQTAMQNFFKGTTSGMAPDLATQICLDRCKNAEALPNQPLKDRSSFCTAKFELDTDGNGEAQFEMEKDPDTGKTNKVYTKFTCEKIGVTCNFTCPA